MEPMTPFLLADLGDYLLIEHLKLNLQHSWHIWGVNRPMYWPPRVGCALHSLRCLCLQLESYLGIPLLIHRQVYPPSRAYIPTFPRLTPYLQAINYIELRPTTYGRKKRKGAPATASRSKVVRLRYKIIWVTGH